MRRFIRLTAVILLCVTLLTACSNQPYPYDLDKHIKICELPTELKVTEDELKDAVAEKVRAAAPRDIQFCDPRLDPCRGAIILAMESAEPENLEKMRLGFCCQESLNC